MYKFEIYQNINIPEVLGGLSDPSRYNLDDYNLEREISPVWSDLSFVWKTENGRKFFRKYLNGEYTLADSDYTWAKSIFDGEYEINRYRYLKVSEKVDGVWTEQWKGFFNAANGEWDFSRCVVKFETESVFDEYSVYIENIEQEMNMIDIPPAISVLYNVGDYLFVTDIVSYSYTVDEFCKTPGVIPPVFKPGDDELFADTKWLLYKKTVTFVSVGECVGNLASVTFNITLEYRRDYVIATDAPSVDWEDSGKPEDPNGNKEWVRYYGGITSPSYNGVMTNLVYPKFPDGCSSCAVYDYCSTLNVEGAIGEVENERGRYLSSVIARISDSISPSGTGVANYKSLFLSAIDNPVTEEANLLREIIIWQITDVKTTSDAATLANYSLQDIEEFILPFNAHWYVDSDGNFRVEHQKYFDNGLSYDDITTVSFDGLDISDIKTTNKIYFSDDLPQTEEYSFSSSNAPDFVGLPIRYSGNIVNRKENSGTKSYSFNNIATDLTNVTSNQDNIGSDGFFMAITYTDGDALRVYEDIGILSGVNIWNIYMSISSLQDKYWKWGRVMSYGTMNGENTEFTQKRVLMQSDITVSNCGDFDPYKLVKTSYGFGKVEEAEITLKDKKLSLTLSY